MACVRVIQVEISGDITVYTCAIINGILKGTFCVVIHELIVFLLFVDLKFSLSLDKSTWDYTYKPLSSVAVNNKGTLDLNTSSCFPDYMISRFLSNLLKFTLS